MRIVAISDTHGSHRKLTVPDGDVLIHAGDFMASGTRPHEIVDFNAWLGDLPHPNKIVVAGNHDILFERNPGLARAFLGDRLNPVTYLLDSGCTIGGLKFWGSPYQPEFNNWAFNLPRGEEIRRHWNMIPADTHVLITHGPPYRRCDGMYPGAEHLGCADLAYVVECIMPTLHIFGHIHGGAGHSRNISTRFYNVAVMNEAYRVVHPATVIDL